MKWTITLFNIMKHSFSYSSRCCCCCFCCWSFMFRAFFVSCSVKGQNHFLLSFRLCKWFLVQARKRIFWLVSTRNFGFFHILRLFLEHDRHGNSPSFFKDISLKITKSCFEKMWSEKKFTFAFFSFPKGEKSPPEKLVLP